MSFSDGDPRNVPSAERYDPAVPDSRIHFFQPNKHALARRVALRREVVATQGRGVIGATYFGSLVHGEAHRESDVDAFIYVDPTTMGYSDHHQIQEGTGIVFLPEIEEELSDDFRARIMRGFEYDPESKNDIRVIPLDDEIINTSTWIAVQNLNYQEAPWQPIRESVRQLLPAANDPDTPYKKLHSAMSGLFHPDITGTLTEPRQLVIDRLLMSGHAGEILWRTAIQSITKMELGESPASIPQPYDNLPASLSRAVATYGLPDYEE